MISSIKGLLVEIGVDTSGLQNALNKVNSASSSLNKELKGINSLLKLDPKNTELLAQKQKVLAENINNTEQKLKALKQAQEDADNVIKNGGKISQENYRALQREIIATENRLKQFKLEASNWTQVGRKLEEIGNKVTNIGTKISNLGDKLTRTLTTSILAVGTVGVKTAIDFESAFAGVEKTVDGTKEQMEELKSGIKKMATEIPSTTTEISKVAETAGQLGIQTENILSFTKTMIDLGNSTNLTAENASTTLARFANITKMSQSDFEKLGSVIVELGNNFATTESEIASMGMNLASAGTQVGMTQSEIMALATALSSVGLEAQAGGTAFSKVMIQMQLAIETGSDELKEFANVAGMTTKDFSKMFKEDATNAIMKFVEGLSKSGEQGKSAIKILDDMGITEVRLRDSLLRSVNASTIFSNAIKLGNKAWKENSALTNEANKRYETTASKITTTINKIKNLILNLGDKLLPIVNKILEKSEQWIEKLKNLDEKQSENIIKIGLMVASASPLIKVMGTITTVAGSTAKGIGIFSQAMGVLKSGGESTSESVNALAKAFTTLSSPIGVVGIGLSAIGISIASVIAYYKSAIKETESLRKSTEQSIKSYTEFSNAINKNMQVKLSDIDRSKVLRQELEKVVDENGKIKEGYESRAKVIVNELSKALGIEINITDNVIEKYKQLQEEVDKLVLKKKAEAILSANEEKYTKAWENRTQKAQELLDIEEKIVEEEEKLKELSLLLNNDKSGRLSNTFKLELDISAVEKNLKNLRQAYNNTKKEVENYTKDINNYNYSSELVAENTTESLTKLINSTGRTYEKNGEIIETTYKKMIQEQQVYVSISEELQKKAIESNNLAEEEKTKKQIEETKTRIANLIEELQSHTSIVEENSPDIIDAWKELALHSNEIYKEEIAKMPIEMREKIEEITGVILNDNEVKNASENLGKNTVSKFEQSIQTARSAGENFVIGIRKGIENYGLQRGVLTAVSILGSRMTSTLNSSLEEHSPSKITEKSGENFVLGAKKGIIEKADDIYKTVGNFGKGIVSKFDENIISKYSQIQKMQELQGNLKSNMINTSKTIFTTPQIVFNVQKLNEENLKQCFNYINRKFGSRY